MPTSKLTGGDKFWKKMHDTFERKSVQMYGEPWMDGDIEVVKVTFKVRHGDVLVIMVGLDTMDTEWVAFLTSDDFFTAITKMLNSLDNNSIRWKEPKQWD